MSLQPSYTLYAAHCLSGYSEIWLRKLCPKLGIGRLEGRQLRFTESDLDTLRAYRERRAK